MRNLLAIAMVLVGVLTLAQEITVTGTVQDNSDLPLAYTSITFDGLDNDIFEQIYTEGDGSFMVHIPAGKYDIIIQPTTGSITERIETFTKDTDLGIIRLSEAIQLASTVAVAERPLYRLELDKRVYDMDRDPTIKGANLSDALNNVPSVTVDGDGTVTLRGSESITVLIDGKPSAMTGISNIADALKNIQADAVQRVEVITNPSARYDAAGTGGIINIIMKKGTNQGFNASFNTNVGIPFQTGVNANLNYKTDKWNFFISPYVRYGRSEGSSSFKNRFYSQFQPDTIETQDGDRIRKRFNYGTGIGFERFIDDRNTLTASVNLRRSTGENENTLNYNDYAGNTLFGKSSRQEIEDETDESIEANVGYRLEFDDKGHELRIETSASFAKEDEFSDIIERTYMGNGENGHDKTSNYEEQTRYLLQADYVYPHGESARFELGYKGQFASNMNDFTVMQRENGEFIENPFFTDVIDYDQNVNALYTQYGNKMGKFSYLLGLRMENSDIRIQSANANDGLGSDDKKNYTNFFPSATLNYSFDEDDRNQLQVSYSKRIRRPWSRWLTPFRNFSDDRNTFMGNPDLDPVFTNAFEMAYITQIGKTSITPSVYYQKSTDNMNVFRRRAEFNGNQIFISQPVNAGDEVRYGAELVAATQFTSWWRAFGNVNFYGYDANGSYYDPISDTTYDLSGDGFSWFGRMSNTFSLPSKIDMQVSGFYYGGSKNAQSERDPMYGVDLALSKDILAGAGTLSFNVRDLFETRRRKVFNFGPGYESNMDMQWRGRQFTLNFAYRINQKKKRERGMNGGVDEAEGMEF
ncbi:TonB-dependent receptor [Weeksellaceae bacterium KMM 9724]|uniref:outer membrane beta-barrel protein n=1 Tax=Profundicola chukchiensis TaxID=2961959 RepID=UPI00243B27B3|nr:outer membrane beta-barrel protein [Profundicola chukchiensis]MDG4949333.1 TonB-dependent receptor [Profundicola chukchiensis]